MGFVGGPKKPVARKGAQKMARWPGISPGQPRKPAPPMPGANIPVNPSQAVLPIQGFNPNTPTTKRRRGA